MSFAGDPMSDHNRGHYSPGGEPPLAFPDRGTPRRSGPAPVTLILSVLLLAVVGGGVFYLYRGGARGAGDAPQPVGAPLHEVRSVAPPEVQTPDPAAGLSIYKDNPNQAGAAPAFVPPPEQPTPRPVVATLAPAGPVAPTGPATPAPLPVVSAAPSPLPVVSTALSPKPAATAKPPAAKAVKAASTSTTKTAPTTKPTPDTLAKAAKPAAASTPGKSGPAVVQIGAYSSQALADEGWNDAAGVAPGAMAGKSKRVAPVTKADGATFYRTSITGFASHADAQALCDRLKAAGKACFVR